MPIRAAIWSGFMLACVAKQHRVSTAASVQSYADALGICNLSVSNTVRVPKLLSGGSLRG